MAAARDAAQSTRRTPGMAEESETFMWLILLEAAIALAALAFMVWWTMFQKPRRKRPRR
jgi:hypothetical protein